MNASKLINIINTVSENNSIEIDGYPNCYAICIEGHRGVAIENYGNIEIEEKFNKVMLTSCSINVSSIKHDVILLYAKEQYISIHLSALFLDFISTTRKNFSRNLYFSWFEEWKELMGNKSTSKMVYDFIGEMKTLLILQKNNLEPSWDSIIEGTYDISTKNALYEVKTTKNKTTEMVEIHNQYQLDTQNLNMPLYIAFCKVEKNDSGESINSLCDDLIKSGFDKNVLEDYLIDNGYSKGKSARYQSYIIHEIRLYPVNDSVPRITKNSFKNDKIPNGVIKYQYTISLDGLEYTKLL